MIAIDQAIRRRCCRRCHQDIQPAEVCITSVHTGMFSRKQSYHIECVETIIQDAKDTRHRIEESIQASSKVC